MQSYTYGQHDNAFFPVHYTASVKQVRGMSLLSVYEK